MYSEKDFISPDYNLHKIEEAIKIKAEAPSNIALVKYWGKYPGQIPMNPSVSFTLTESKTETQAEIQKKTQKKEDISFDFYFEGNSKPDFEPKIRQFLNNILPYAPFIKDFHFRCESRNTFPHSSGIASSASAFAALAKIIIALEKKISAEEKEEDFWKKKTSFLARIGSGSASRSIERPIILWGEHPQIKESSNLYASPVQVEIHPVFQDYRDSIVLVEKGQKKVSSSAGHQLMNAHPYKDMRQKQAFENTLKIIDILQSGNQDEFIRLVESEALTLHAMMMTSNPNYLLMQPETLKIIHQIRNFRKETGSKLCFTLDAGANVHVLYPKTEQKAVKYFLNSITDKEILDDYVKMN